MIKVGDLVRFKNSYLKCSFGSRTRHKDWKNFRSKQRIAKVVAIYETKVRRFHQIKKKWITEVNRVATLDIKRPDKVFRPCGTRTEKYTSFGHAVQISTQFLVLHRRGGSRRGRPTLPGDIRTRSGETSSMIPYSDHTRDSEDLSPSSVVLDPEPVLRIRR